MKYSLILLIFIYSTAAAQNDNIIRNLTSDLSAAETRDDVNKFISFFEPGALCITDYQPPMRGSDEISVYYAEIFKRQKIRSFQRKADEIINLGNTVVEVGTFKKEFISIGSDTVVSQYGKYCHVWNEQPDGTYKIKGQVYGFLHHINDPNALQVNIATRKAEDVIHPVETVPLELRALNALMEKYVREGQGALRALFFTDDGRFMPFANPIVAGINELKPYLTAYDTRGKTFRFDTLIVYTYDYEYFDGFVLEYPRFMAKWSDPPASGAAKGGGLRLWRRQEDKSLKIYLEIGTHN